MNTTHTTAPRRLPVMGLGLAGLLLAGTAIASLAISAQGFDGVFSAPTPPKAAAPPAATALSASRCAECGVIESTRRIEELYEDAGVSATGRSAAGSPDRYEAKRGGSYVITIRLRDGTWRTITDANAASWRPGERVILISAAR